MRLTLALCILFVLTFLQAEVGALVDDSYLYDTTDVISLDDFIGADFSADDARRLVDATPDEYGSGEYGSDEYTGSGGDVLDYDAVTDHELTENIGFTSFVPVANSFTSFTVDPSFPAGIGLNPETGVVWGTPSEAADETDYLITATDDNGHTSTWTFTFTVLGGTVFMEVAFAGNAEDVLATEETLAAYTDTVETDISNAIGIAKARVQVTEVYEGSIMTKFIILPTSDPTQPTVAAAASDLETQSQTDGSAFLTSATAPVKDSLAALPTPPSFILYTASNTLSVNEGTTIDYTPTHLGGTAESWAISAFLPTGVSFDTTTGQISGTTPAVGYDVTTMYTITATNTGGSSSIDFYLTQLNVAEAPVDPVVVAEEEDDDDNNVGLIVGLIFGFAICLPLTAYLIIRFRKEMAKQEPGVDEEVQGDFGVRDEQAAQALVDNPDKAVPMEEGALQNAPADDANAESRQSRSVSLQSQSQRRSGMDLEMPEVEMAQWDEEGSDDAQLLIL